MCTFSAIFTLGCTRTRNYGRLVALLSPSYFHFNLKITNKRNAALERVVLCTGSGTYSFNEQVQDLLNIESYFICEEFITHERISFNKPQYLKSMSTFCDT